MTDQLTIEALKPLLTELVPKLRAKRKRLRPVVEHLRKENKTYAKRGQTAEHRYIDELTHTPWGTKVATTYAQELSVSGFATPDSEPEANDPAWELWDEARMDLMQDILIREALQYGESFGAALTSKTRKVYAKPLPPMQTVAKYDDPVTDIWPKAVLSTRADRKTAAPVSGTLYVADWVYNIEFPDGLDADSTKFTTCWQHRSEETPIVRLIDEIDSEGNTTGKIEPLLPIIERIRKDTYDRQLIQHKSSWKVRWATGLEPDENQTTDETKLRLAVEDILVSSDPNAKFGTLDESPLEGLIAAKESDVLELCVMAQIPPSAGLPGKIANISAETIAELRNGFENRIADHKTVLGDAFRWFIQALAIQAGEVADPKARCQWEDRASRSLAQAADAWSKIVPTLNVPYQAAWEHLPGITGPERRRWENMLKRAEGREMLAAIFAPPQAPAIEAQQQAPAIEAPRPAPAPARA